MNLGMAHRNGRAMPPQSERPRVRWLFFVVLSAIACNLPMGLPPASPTPLPSPTPTPEQVTASPQPAPSATLPFPDASSVLAGVCFSFLETLDGQTVVLDSPRDLSAFYDQVDKSKRCRD